MVRKELCYRCKDIYYKKINTLEINIQIQYKPNQNFTRLVCRNWQTDLYKNVKDLEEPK